MKTRREILDIAHHLNVRFFDYHQNRLNIKPDFKLASLYQSCNLTIRFRSFSTTKFCGMMMLDELENTVLIKSELPKPRRLFTYAHELGHFVCHKKERSQFVDFGNNLAEDSENMIENPIDELEVQANLFASEMLIPKLLLINMLNEKYSFYKIGKITGASYQCVKWRLVRHLKERYKFSQKQSLLLIDNFEDLSKDKYYPSASIFYLDRQGVDLDTIFHGIEKNINY